MKHDGYIDNLLGSGSFDATCSCGWESTGHEDHEVAEDALDEHYRSVRGEV